MTFKITETSINSAVASAGTITFTYPDNTSAGNFVAYGHKLWVDKHQKIYTSPTDFTVSFGASDITVTYNASTTIPVGAVAKLQANIAGSDTGEALSIVDENAVKRTVLMNFVKVSLGSPDILDANGICASQTINTTASLDGALVSGGVATLDVPRNIVAAWTNTATITITGTDEYGNTMVETSASGTSHTGKKAFKTVTGVVSSTSITSATVGTDDVFGLPFFVGGAGEIIQEFENGALLIRKNGKVYLQDRLIEADVDAGTPKNIVSPVAGNISKLTTVCDSAVTTGGAVTVEVNTVAVTGLSLTIADSAAEGEVDSDTPTAGHATTLVAVGDRIEIIPAAAIDASADIFYILEIELDESEQLNGTFVAGVSSAATATTGDVRGTYNPTTAADGSTAFDLVIASPDPKYLGVAQYAG